VSEGWIALHRGWRDNPVFKGEFSRADAWIWLIEAACWKAARFDIKGRTVILQRGQLCASREQMAAAWQWSPSAVERFLARLKTEQMIERETGQGKSVITICNYAKYQNIGEQTGQEPEQQIGQEPDRNRTAKEQGNKGTSDEVAEATPSQRGGRATRIPECWMPAPLPPNVAELVAVWPGGRETRELDGFRDYWTARKRDAARLDWDKTWHNRIRDIHDKVLRDARYDRQHSPSARPKDGVADALDRRIRPVESAGETERRNAGLGEVSSGGAVALIAGLR
jgi:hypothetical protein